MQSTRRLVSMMRATISALSFCSALAASARGEKLPIALTVSACDELSESELRRIVAAELGATAVERKNPATTEVFVECQGDLVLLRVRDPLTRKAVGRSFDIGLSDRAARDRLVALAVSELVLSSWAELRVNPTPRVEPLGPRPPESETSAARAAVSKWVQDYEPEERTWYELEAPAERRFRLLPVFSMRSFFKGIGTLRGGGLRAGEERFRFMSWDVDALFEEGSLATHQGTYRIQTFTLGGGLYAYLRAKWIIARLGAGLRAGFIGSGATVTGAPGGSSSFAVWGWPLARSSVTFPLGPHFVADIAGEAGYAVLPIPSAEGPGVSGGWIGGQIGLGFVP